VIGHVSNIQHCVDIDCRASQTLLPAEVRQRVL
jgi:hypothetical protein